MRARIYTLWAMFFFCSIGMLQAQDNSIELIYPSHTDVNGSETLTAGQTYNIEWRSSGVENVKIEYSTDDGVKWTTIIASTPDEPMLYSWKVPGPVTAAARVRVSDASNAAVSDVSDLPVNVTAPAGPVLALPLDKTVKVDKALEVSWAAVTGAVSYRVQASVNADFSGTVLTSNTTALKDTLRNLQYGSKYYWRVGALITGITEPVYSASYYFKTKMNIPGLASPTDKALAVRLPVTLKWAAVTGADKYTVQISVNDDFTGASSVTDITADNVEIADLENNTLYYWRVKAVQNQGSDAAENESDFSAGRQFTTIIGVPELTSPLGEGIKYFKVTYNWIAVPGASGYQLEVSKDENFITDKKSYSVNGANTYTAADLLEAGQKYYWRVQAKSGAFTSDYSTAVNFTVGIPASNLGSAVFDHTTGSITQIKAPGSTVELLNSALNSKNKWGLGRISGETGTKLISWTADSFTYENILYGSKTITVNTDAGKVTVDMVLNLAANRTAVLNAAWMPGGQLNPMHDYIMYEDASGKFNKHLLTYPGSASALYSGITELVAMNDDSDEDEWFGFKSSPGADAAIQQGLAFGPAFTYRAGNEATTFNLSFAAGTKDGFFTWAGKKYIVITEPAAGVSLLNKSEIKVSWDSYGISSNDSLVVTYAPDGINFSGWGGKVAAGSNTFKRALRDSAGISSALIKLTTTSGIAGLSAPFTVVNDSSSTIRIDDITGSPTDKILVPVLFEPGIDASVAAFDIRLEYNKDVLSFVKGTKDSSLANWTADATNNLLNGFVQIGGFRGTAGTAITAGDTLMTIEFNVKNSARVGTTSDLKINNSYLSIVDTGAHTLNVMAVDGKLTLYSRVSGFARYIMNKKPINGTDLFKFKNEDSEVEVTGSTTLGFFDFSNAVPGSKYVLTPVTAGSYPDEITDAITSADAAKAFAGREGGSLVLSDLQKIAADVNNDGRLNSTDAYAILKISSGVTDIVAFDNWIFVDSLFKFVNGNWAQASKTRTYDPLDTVKANQSFWGMLRGDVDGSYIPNAEIIPLASDGEGEDVVTGAVEYSLPKQMLAKAGDTVYVPLNVKLNGRMIGALNASILLNKNIAEYTGQYRMGSSMPEDKGWVMSTYYDSTGKLNIAATDLEGVLNSIYQDGVIAEFAYVVNRSAVIGDSTMLQLKGVAAADAQLNNLTVGVKEGKMFVSNITGVERNTVVTEYSLEQNYPNPFNPTTVIEYALPFESRVEVVIYNYLGERVQTLVSGVQTSGYHRAEWNAGGFASGVYFYQIHAAAADGKEFKQVRKMMLVK